MILKVWWTKSQYWFSENQPAKTPHWLDFNPDQFPISLCVCKNAYGDVREGTAIELTATHKKEWTCSI